MNKNQKEKLNNVKNNDNKKVIIFTAHPDDHLCCAGTIMYLKDLGFTATEIVFTGGENSMWLENSKVNNKEINKEELKNHRKIEILKASKLIGIEKTIFLGLPDGNVARSPEILEKLVEIIREERPQIAISINPKDSHHDHKQVGKIASEAIEMASWKNAKGLGKTHRIALSLYMEGVLFGRNDVLVDISKYLKRKDKVVEVYRSQITNEERKMLEAMNVYRGFHKGSVSAEAFEIAEDCPMYFNELFDIFKNK